jgi:hypothetical protein
MSTITTLRPSSTSSFTGWTATPSGTLHGVTSDDSDSTYALWSGTGAPLVLQTPIDAPPAGERRHQVRVRARGEDGSAWWAVRLQNGALTGGASATFPASPATVLGSWGFGVPPDGNTILAAQVLGQTTGAKITEIYLDVDSREAPDVTVEVIDGSGASVTTVTDTATPTLHATSITTDGLALRQFRFWVTSGSTIVWDTGILSGAPSDQTVTPLDNGSYVAHVQVWTTLGTATAYPSPQRTLAFDVLAATIQMPAEPTAELIEGTPFYEVTVCSPIFGGYVHLQRIDCANSDTPAYNDLAMLGPLETDQCATYTDFAVPRTGQGATCEHLPEDCCSYYRARAIYRYPDGQVEISEWTDARGSGIPEGLIFLWPSTAASIPAGWGRQAALDGKYAKGLTDPSYQPGDITGGQDTHNHFGGAGAHTHDITHGHTVTGNTSAAVGTVVSGAGGAGTQGVPATHTHTRSALASTTLASGSNGASVSAVSNDPAKLTVIHIESDGTATGIPAGALGVSGDTPLAGWSDYASATGRFLKGAAPGADGGAIAASARNHSHALGAHTHTGPSHTHTSPNVGNVAGTLSLTGGAGASVTYSVNHSHPVTVSDATAAALASGGAGTSSAVNLDDPLWVNVRVKENVSGGPSIPQGIVGIWRGSLGSIPPQWELCDGTGGKPNLTSERYPRGATSAIGATGGVSGFNSHTHSQPAHTHTTSGHTHAMTIGASNGSTANAVVSNVVSVALGTHTHTGSVSDSTTPAVSSVTPDLLVSQESEPPFEEVAFVQLMEPFVPHPGPEEICFQWDDGEHLLRTNGPDGPLWASLSGKFAWDVERPLTVTTGVNGGRYATSGNPGQRNHTLATAVESEEELGALLAVLRRPLVLISPSDSREVWGAPIAASITVVKVGRIRQVTVEFTGTGPQPGPQILDL